MNGTVCARVCVYLCTYERECGDTVIVILIAMAVGWLVGFGGGNRVEWVVVRGSQATMCTAVTTTEVVVYPTIALNSAKLL